MFDNDQIVLSVINRMILNQSLDFHQCMDYSCLVIPFLLWVALDVAFVFCAALLTAYGEVILMILNLIN